MSLISKLRNIWYEIIVKAKSECAFYFIPISDVEGMVHILYIRGLIKKSHIQAEVTMGVHLWTGRAKVLEEKCCKAIE